MWSEFLLRRKSLSGLNKDESSIKGAHVCLCSCCGAYVCLAALPYLTPLLGWVCGANQLLYLHILPSLCVQCLQPPLINAVERRQMKRRAEGREMMSNSQEGIHKKAELQKKWLAQWLGFESLLHAKLTSYLHSTSLSLQTTLQGTY